MFIPYTLEDVRKEPLNRVERFKDMGLLDEGVWEAYCYLWRTSCHRDTIACRYEALRHAQKYNLPTENI